MSFEPFGVEAHRTLRSRRGVALLWALVVIALLTALVGTLIAQIRASRRQLEHRQNQLQVEWLVRAGLELAAARLLSNPASYKDESLKLIEHSQVNIKAETDARTPDTFQVSSQANYPTDSPEAVEFSLARRFRRLIEKDRVRLKVVAGSKENAPSSLPR
jgi:hypothetical protein